VVLNQGGVLRTAMLSLANVVTNPSAVASITQVAPAEIVNTLEPLVTIESVEPLWVVEKRTIEKAIEECGGNVNKAARLLEVAPSTIYRKLQAWEDNTVTSGATS